MTLSLINLGTTVNDGTGDKPEPAGVKINAAIAALNTLMGSGGIGLGLIAGGGATTGQVLSWNGTAWAPSAVTTVANLLDFPIVGGNDGLLAANQTIAVADVLNPALWPVNASQFRLGSFNGTTATSITIFTLRLNRGGTISTVATATVAPGASVASWGGYTQPTEQLGDYFYLQAPSTPDATFGWTACTIPRSKQ